jgi:hypothetical protein
MEITGAAYLNTLATLSITFVGFSALLIFFRQIAGGGMSKYDNYFVLTFIQTGFIVTIGSIIPQVVHSFGNTEALAWRIASGLIVIPLLLFVATLPGRRKAVTGSSMPFAIRVPLACQWGAALMLALNAAGTPMAPAFPLYGTALAIVLITAMSAFLFALGIIFGETGN